MALCIPHSVFHLARLLYVRPENFGPYYGSLALLNTTCKNLKKLRTTFFCVIFSVQEVSQVCEALGSQSCI